VPTFIHFKNPSTLPTMASSSNPKGEPRGLLLRELNKLITSKLDTLKDGSQGIKRALKIIIVKFVERQSSVQNL